MRKSRFTEEQIIAVLKAAEAGQKVQDLCRKHGISEHTFYRWRAKYGGMDVSDAKKLRALEDENRRLKTPCWYAHASRARLVNSGHSERILREMAETVGIATRALSMPLRYAGNAVSANVALALARAREDGLLAPGVRVLLASAGSGFSANATAVRW